MITPADFYRRIDQQLFHNRNKSLFFTLPNGKLTLNASEETADFLKKTETLTYFINSIKTDGSYQQLLRNISARVIQSFMQVNQFLDFDYEDSRKLQKIYGDLFERIYVNENNDLKAAFVREGNLDL